jgi:predicted RNA-binding protein YlxR (DUF448 family)
MTKGNSKYGTIKHVPQRTCVACRVVHDKKDMVRLVCNPDGTIEADLSGKKAGRGAYLCRAQECWEEGCKSNKLGHALKTGITIDNREQLLSWIRNYLEGNNGTG